MRKWPFRWGTPSDTPQRLADAAMMLSSYGTGGVP